MISLKEILHTIGEEKRSGLIPIENWRWPDVNHLATMGFGFDGDYYMQTDLHPRMKIYKKAEKTEGEEKETEYFYLEEPKKELKRFEQFNDLVDFFDSYEQPEIDKNM